MEVIDDSNKENTNRYNWLLETLNWDLLSEGGQGNVFLSSNKRYVLKVFEHNDIDTSISEYRIMRNCQHIVKIPKSLALIRHNNKVCLLMEYINGKTLLDIITSRQWEQLTQKERLDFTTKVIFNLSYNVSLLHQHGVVHRDLKPDNIIITQEGDVITVTLIDFGLACSLDNSKAVQDTACGTFNFLSPLDSKHLLYQVFSGDTQSLNKDMTPQLAINRDIWAIANILYLVITNELLFDGRDPVQILKKVLTYRETVESSLYKVENLFYRRLLGDILADPKKTLSAKDIVHKVAQHFHLVEPIPPSAAIYKKTFMGRFKQFFCLLGSRKN